jgi:prepilin-type N-terminal cleavage/methylation domain-containing protein
MGGGAAMSNERGFSLVELLIAVAVLGLMMAGLLGVQQQGVFAYLVGAGRVEVQQNGRVALDIMTADIRAARSVTAVGAGCNTGPITTGGGATTISITDQDGTAVQFQVIGTDLQKNGAVLMGGIQSLRIWCLDATNALTATPGDIRAVHVQVATQTEQPVAPGSPRDQHARLEARVALRNVL